MIRSPIAKGAVVIQESEQSFVLMCPHCTYTTEKKANWYKHTKTHTETKAHVCDICSYACKTASNLKRHLRTHQGLKLYSCEICSKAFHQKHNLLRHMKSQHEQKRVCCAACGDFFLDFDKLSDHMMRKHKGVPGEETSCNKVGQPSVLCNLKTYTCRSCLEVFTNRKSYQQHLKVHGKCPELKHTCKICCYMTDNVSKLRRHELIHSKAKPYNCALCEYRSTQKDHIIRHMRARHPGNTDRDVQVQLHHKPELNRKRSADKQDMPSRLIRGTYSGNSSNSTSSVSVGRSHVRNSVTTSKRADHHSEGGMGVADHHSEGGMGVADHHSEGRMGVADHHSKRVMGVTGKASCSQFQSNNVWLSMEDIDIGNSEVSVESVEHIGDSLPCVLVADTNTDVLSATDVSNDTCFVIVGEMNSHSVSGVNDAASAMLNSNGSLSFDKCQGLGLCTAVHKKQEGEYSVSEPQYCLNHLNGGVDTQQSGDHRLTSKSFIEADGEVNKLECSINKGGNNGSNRLAEHIILTSHIEDTSKDTVTRSNHIASRSNLLVSSVNATDNRHLGYEPSGNNYCSKAANVEVASECYLGDNSTGEKYGTESAIKVYMVNKDNLLVQDSENPYVFYRVNEQQQPLESHLVEDEGHVFEAEPDTSM